MRGIVKFFQTVLEGYSLEGGAEKVSAAAAGAHALSTLLVASRRRLRALDGTASPLAGRPRTAQQHPITLLVGHARRSLASPL